MEDLKKVYIEDEMKNSYLDYSMSVIVGRALPDVRDGLKPVHRRILFAMNETGMHYNKAHKKSARIVGEVLGKYHPHGDVAIYQSMVRMAQDFNTRYLLIDGQGNFGSVDGDMPASLRYTEARMSRFSSELVADIDKNTVNFRKNFDETLEEPEVLPSVVPNLLLNGSAGIAVGMATNIPPHNINEIIDAEIAYIRNNEISIEELMEYVKGPDFPTGGLIYGYEGIKSAYHTGRGKIRVRGKAEIELNGNTESIIITEIPYQVNKASMVEQIAELVKEKKIEGISALRDESDRDGLRVYIEIRKSEDAEVILNKIYKYTNLEVSYGIIMLSLVKNSPRVLNLKEMIMYHVEHRFEVVTRRVQFDLDKAQQKHHILEGFKIAITNIDAVVQLIKSSSDSNDAHNKLMLQFSLSDRQAKAILEMRLSKLTALEVTKLEEELAQLVKEIAEYIKILSDKAEIYNIIEQELLAVKEKYGQGRKSQIVDDINTSIEDIIKDEDVLITITSNGYVKRLTMDNYKAQARGGKGYTGQNLAEEDLVKSMTYARNLDTLLIFTSKGKVYSLKAYEIPELARNAKGRLMSNILPFSIGERVKAIINLRELTDDKSIFFITKNGIAKKTLLKEYKNINKSGIIALKLKDKDDLINAFLVTDSDEIFIATRNGYSLRFKVSEVRTVGRASFGVKGINLRAGDMVVNGLSVSSESVILTVSEKGYGKKSKISNYNLISRGRKGVINMRVSKKTGLVISSEDVIPNDEIILITSKGSVIRTTSNEISTVGRATQGVKVMRLRDEESVVDCVKIRSI